MEINFDPKLTNFSQVEPGRQTFFANTSFTSSIKRVEQQAEPESSSKGCFGSLKDKVVGFFNNIRKLFLKICCFCIKKKYEIEVTGSKGEDRILLINKKVVAGFEFHESHSKGSFYRFLVIEEKFFKYPKAVQDQFAQKMIDTAKENKGEGDHAIFPLFMDKYLTDSLCEEKRELDVRNKEDGSEVREIAVKFKRSSV